LKPEAEESSSRERSNRVNHTTINTHPRITLRPTEDRTEVLSFGEYVGFIAQNTRTGVWWGFRDDGSWVRNAASMSKFDTAEKVVKEAVK
jgi:hypothetical protein